MNSAPYAFIGFFKEMYITNNMIYDIVEDRSLFVGKRS